VGESTFYNGTSSLSPDGGPGYWTITGKRDVADGYAGIFIDYSDGKLSTGLNGTGSSDPNWVTMIDDTHNQTINGVKTFNNNIISKGNNSISSNILVRNTANQAGFIWLDSSNALRLDAGSTSVRNIILNGGGNGSVGVGTPSPSEKLDVNGNGRFNEIIGTTTNNNSVSSGTAKVDGFGLLGNRNVVYITNQQSNGQIKFGIGGVHGTASEKMTLNSNGNLGIGVSSPSHRLEVNGNILASGDVTAYSDERLKENITLIPNSLDKINQLNGYTFTRNDSEDKDEKHTGVIAQEVLKVLPEAVRGSEDTNYSVAYGNMVGLLIEGIKEQQKRIEELEARLEKVENK